MTKEIGVVGRTAEFLRRMTKYGVSINTGLVKSTLDFLIEIDELVQSTPSRGIEVVVNVSDGIWIFYNGEVEFFLKPTQKYIKLHQFRRNDLSRAIEKLEGKTKGTKLFQTRIKKKYAYRIWHIQSEELRWLTMWMRNRPVPNGVWDIPEGAVHPRYFPGELRNRALSDFIRSGRICPGVFGLSKKHKLGKYDRIEFDHVLPYAKGGPSTWQNLQILCVECNRLKANSAR